MQTFCLHECLHCANMLGMENLKSYLERTGTSQSALASKVGISRAFMSELVGGTKTPSLPVAAAIEKLTRGKVKAVSFVSDSPEASQ